MAFASVLVTKPRGNKSMTLHQDPTCIIFLTGISWKKKKAEIINQCGIHFQMIWCLSRLASTHWSPIWRRTPSRYTTSTEDTTSALVPNQNVFIQSLYAQIDSPSPLCWTAKKRNSAGEIGFNTGGTEVRRVRHKMQPHFNCKLLISARRCSGRL